MISKTIQHLSNNPDRFIEKIFGDSLWEMQRDISRSLQDYKRVSIKSCHGSGKTWLAARIALQFLYSHPNSKVITTAPSFRQVTDILWRELANAWNKANGDYKVLGGSLSTTKLNIDDEWFALGLSTNEPDRFQGFHAENILLVCDEASGIKEEIYTASEGILSSGNSRELLIGNPTNITGTFHRSFELPNYKTFHISAFDTPNFTEFGITLEDIKANKWEEKIIGKLPRPYLVTPEWVYDKYLRWGEGSPMWESRVLGEFPTQGTDTLIPLFKIEEATNKLIESISGDPENIGCDVARYGDDKTVFLYRKGATVLDIKTYTLQDTVQTANNLFNYMSSRPYAFTRIDGVGVGAGVVDTIKRLARFKTYEDVNVGKASQKPELFKNLRAEIYWNLRERFINGDISIPDDDELKSQLASIKYFYTIKGQVEMESKEDMKKRGLPSPDKADALALAFMSGKIESGILQFASMYNKNNG